MQLKYKRYLLAVWFLSVKEYTYAPLIELAEETKN